MAQALVGKWKPDRISYAEAEEYFTALGQSETFKGYEGATEVEISLDGNKITSVTRFEDKEPRTDVANIGETDEHVLPNGAKLQAKTRLEGDRLVSDLYLGDNLVMSFARYVKGNELFSEITANGKSQTFKSVRV